MSVAVDGSDDWHARYAEVLARLPGSPSATYPEGEPFARALAHGTLTVEVFAPKLEDRQQPHAQDELYLVHAGTSGFVRDGDRVQVRGETETGSARHALR